MKINAFFVALLFAAGCSTENVTPSPDGPVKTPVPSPVPSIQGPNTSSPNTDPPVNSTNLDELNGNGGSPSVTDGLVDPNKLETPGWVKKTDSKNPPPIVIPKGKGGD